MTEGAEWDLFAGLDLPAERLSAFLKTSPRPGRCHAGTRPRGLDAESSRSRAATGVDAGSVRPALIDIARAAPTSPGGRDASPDVTVSTNLGALGQPSRDLHRTEHADIFRDETSSRRRAGRLAPHGRHIELGIAENNLFLQFSAFGLAEPLFGTRLLPIGTLYDPFINRGLDALNYACYQDARFLLVATPSGLTLAPEGGAHQSIATPLIGIGQPGLTYFEPAFVDELQVAWLGLPAHAGARRRLGLFALVDPHRRTAAPRQLTGVSPRTSRPADIGCASRAGGEIAVIAMGAVVPEAMTAMARIGERTSRAGLLVITSPDRLHRDWRIARQRRQWRRRGCWRRSPAMPLSSPCSTATRYLVVAWCRARPAHRPARRHRIRAIGRHSRPLSCLRIDADAIDAAARACLLALHWTRPDQ